MPFRPPARRDRDVLGTGLPAVVTAVTPAGRLGLASTAPVVRVAVPWTPLVVIALVCLLVAVLASVLTAAAALRDPRTSVSM